MLRADLGPTNTGKTHFAIERMLSFRSGVIGLPLRLLAREIYDKIVARIGAPHVALLTGEERIVPPKARYWVATVEAMPLDFGADILIVDEVQLAADPDRGYIFTDRILHARGTKETLFLGSETIRPRLEALFPDIVFSRRERLSALTYAGRKKLNRLPERSAVVAFSVEEVYALAELIRRQMGGVAVVMGALSPQTRNAQVDLFQSGEVDYLVATDAIGMGLNLDLHNVYFSNAEKFDGRRFRPLFPYEIGQIAGRAGRYTRDGQFGVTASQTAFDDEMVRAIETHRYAPIKNLEWRNSALDFHSIDHLLKSLEMPAHLPNTQRAREADDLRTLRMLARSEAVRHAAKAKPEVTKLWAACQIPDFPKLAVGEHIALAESVFQYLVGKSGVIAEDYIAKHVSRLESFQGGIDILSRRLSQIRTWTYISQRSNWLNRAQYWQEKTRDVENRLSDALHESLIERFIDRRTTTLMRRLKMKENLMASVTDEGVVEIDGQFVGQLEGFRFLADPKAVGQEAKTLVDAAAQSLAPIFTLRADKLYLAGDKEISLTDQGALFWQDAVIGNLKKGGDAFRPNVAVFADEIVPAAAREKIQKRLEIWVQRRADEVLAPLFALRDDEGLDGAVRGLAYQLVEAFGVLPRATVADTVKNLSQDERGRLRKHGVRFGQYSIFMPLLLKPAPTELRLVLSALWRDEDVMVSAPPAGLVTIPANDDYAPHHYDLAGYKLSGSRAIRIDMLERLADMLRDKDRIGGFEASGDMLSITGLSLEQFADLMQGLGFVAEQGERAKLKNVSAASSEPTVDEKPSETPVDPSDEQEPTEAVAATDADTTNTAIESEVETKLETEVEAEVEVFYTFKIQRQKPSHQGKRRSNDKAPRKDKGRKHSGKPQHQSKAPRREKTVDPDNPFAALAQLKANMK